MTLEEPKVGLYPALREYQILKTLSATESVSSRGEKRCQRRSRCLRKECKGRCERRTMLANREVNGGGMCSQV